MINVHDQVIKNNFTPSLILILLMQLGSCWSLNTIDKPTDETQTIQVNHHSNVPLTLDPDFSEKESHQDGTLSDNMQSLQRKYTPPEYSVVIDYILCLDSFNTQALDSILLRSKYQFPLFAR